MAVRNQIAAYLPKRSMESARAIDALDTTLQPTPEQLAEMSRALQLIERTGARPGVMTTVPDEITANLQTFMSLVAAERGQPVIESNNRALEVQFDERDIVGWAKSFFTWWRKLKKFDWQKPGAPLQIDDTFRMAVLGDWGTGMYGAPVCAASVAADGNYHLLLHLGDVYYSGMADEYKERFSDLWPHVPNAISRVINGNHEMYTGGHAYFDVFRNFGQEASYFALENDRWILACLDTAYDDHDLHADQATWLEGLVAGSDKRLVLFSHHQPYSLLDHQGPNLVRQLGSLLAAKRIHAWYWGHEHHCVLYEPHPFWGLHGRCIGHSGFPYFREKQVLGERPPKTAQWHNLPGKNLVPGARVLDGINAYIDDHPEDYGPNGYVTLEFNGPNMYEIVHEADGHVVWNQPVGDET